MPTLNRGKVKIAWNDQGSGVPILLIMGHRYSSRMWYPVFEGLGDRYRLISFDNQGAGESGSRSKTTVREMTDDALAVLDAAGVESAHIYGVSMGGGIALEFGIRYPERTRSLILGCTLAKTPDIPRANKTAMNIIYRLPMWMLRGLGSKQYKGGYGDAAPDAAIERDKEIVKADAFTRRGVIAQGMAIADYTVDPADVAAVKAPTLVLHGTQDLAVPYEAGKKLSQQIPGAQMVAFEGAGHNYFVAAAAEANAAVDNFIKTVEQKR